jgi:hypothetical protein
VGHVLFIRLEACSRRSFLSSGILSFSIDPLTSSKKLFHVVLSTTILFASFKRSVPGPTPEPVRKASIRFALLLSRRHGFGRTQIERPQRQRLSEHTGRLRR